MPVSWHQGRVGSEVLNCGCHGRAEKAEAEAGGLGSSRGTASMPRPRTRKVPPPALSSPRSSRARWCQDGGGTEGPWYLSRPTQPRAGHSLSRYLLSTHWAPVSVASAEDQSKVPAAAGCTLELGRWTVQQVNCLGLGGSVFSEVLLPGSEKVEGQTRL